MVFLLALIKLITFSYADDDESCRYFKYCGSNSPQKSSKSTPSPSIASAINPANISKIKGLGLELIYQPSNSVGYALVSGTGKVGGAFLASSGENTFFGNRTIELDEVYLKRRLDDKWYKNKKLQFALGFSIFEQKNFSFDLGVSVKRNSDTSRLSPGYGFSGRFYFLNFGLYTYADDTKINLGDAINPDTGIPYTTQYNAPTYEEKFNVQTYTVGTKIKNLALDAALTKTNYDFYRRPTYVRIYSSSYVFRKFIFNLAYRNEDSDNQKEKNGHLFFERKKEDVYGGIQFLINKHLVVGAAYNHFLLKEISGNLTLFL